MRAHLRCSEVAGGGEAPADCSALQASGQLVHGVAPEQAFPAAGGPWAEPARGWTPDLQRTRRHHHRTT